MEGTYKFKIQPAKILILDLLTAPLIYTLFNSLFKPTPESTLFFCGLFLIIILIYIGPLNMKMMLGYPAMVLTTDCLADKIARRSIPWDNIADIRLIEGNYRSFDKLVINLKRPKEYFNTPLKKMLYKFKQLFTADDISIMIDFLSGSREEVVSVIRAYWDKNAGL